MSETTSVPVPLKHVARWCRIGDRISQQLAHEGVFVRVSHGRYNLEVSVGNYVEKLRASAAGRAPTGDELDLTKERARLASEQADQVALKNAIARKEFIPVAETERQLHEDYRSMQRHMLGVPSKIQQRLSGLTVHDVQEIDRAIREALEEAAEAVIDDAKRRATVEELAAMEGVQ